MAWEGRGGCSERTGREREPPPRAGPLALCPSLPRPRSSAPAKRALLRAVGHGAGPGPPHGAQGPGGALRLRAAPRDGCFLGRSRPGGDEASCRVSTQRSLLLDPPPHLLHTTGHLWPVWKDWPVAGPQAKVRAACSPGTRGLRSPACAPGRCEALQSTCPGPCSQPPRTRPGACAAVPKPPSRPRGQGARPSEQDRKAGWPRDVLENRAWAEPGRRQLWRREWDSHGDPRASVPLETLRKLFFYFSEVKYT